MPKKIKVLIVDDNPKFLSYLCDGLKKYESQFLVSRAIHAKEATEALKKAPVTWTGANAPSLL